ncbi:MAG: glycosyltransferase [Chloroflexota bacterium]|nr:glycosyltransferase [Chloroflexota bacterium]
MYLIIFGSSVVSAYWNGAATYYRGMCRALHARGHRIRFVEQDIYERQQHRDLPADPPYCEVRVVTGWAALVRELESARAEADLILKCNDTGAFDREMEEWLVGAAGGARGAGGAGPSGPPVAFWDVDAPATLAECAAPGSYLRPLIPRFAGIFTYGGGAPVVDGYRALGARCVVPVYNAVDPEAYHPVAPSDDYACDLFFMGNRMPDREARFQHFFLGAAERVPKARFLLGGAGWESLALPPSVRSIGHCPTPLHPQLNCSARLVLNLNRDAMAATGFSPPTRVFEATACGACVVTDAWEGVAQFFTPGAEILVAQGPEDLAGYIADISPGTAQAIGRRARQRVLRDHTYASRAAVFERAAGELL